MISFADALCYGALVLNIIAMSRTRLIELRLLSITANLLLGAYALSINGGALAVSAALIIVAHGVAMMRRSARLSSERGG